MNTEEFKIDTAVLHKEIDLIQSCITRMASNSFYLKGWTVSLIAVVLALAGEKTNSIYLFVILSIPLICFWFLDAFFLQTERKYRKMYEWILENRITKKETSYLYDLNPQRFNSQVSSKLRIMFSITLGTFYGIPVLLTMLALIILIYF